MKSIYKIFLILIFSALLSLSISSVCFADDEGSVISIVAPESAAVGSTITAQVVLSGADKLYGGNVAVRFKRSILEIQSITAGSTVSGLSVTTNLQDEEYQSIITFASTDAADMNGVIAELTFTVKNSGDADIKITESSTKFNDSLTTVIDYTVVNAVVSAYEEALSGDVNGDGSTDLLDAIAILKYLDGETLDETALSAADADGNGTVEKADAAYILKSVLNAE